MRHIVIVTGGRDYDDREHVFATLDEVHARRPITLIRHGACTRKGSNELSGADGLAEEWAKARKVSTLHYPADWRRLGPAAGPIRNQKMVAAGADLAVAFRGRTGTADCVRRCAHADIPVIHA